MSDEKFTKIAVGLLTNVRDLVDWGVEGGHTTADRLRLTVEARKEVVAQLHEQGLSTRQIGAAVGASPMTVLRDLGVSNDTKSVSNETEPEPSECDEPHWHSDVKVRWRSSLLLSAEKSADMLNHWDESFTGWRDFNADRKILSAVKKAVKTWQCIAATLEEKTSHWGRT